MIKNQLIMLALLVTLAGCATRGATVSCDGRLQPINAWPIDDTRKRRDSPDSVFVQPTADLPP